MISEKNEIFFSYSRDMMTLGNYLIIPKKVTKENK